MAFIETIEDFAGDVKEKVGDKGFYLLLAAAAGLGIYSFVKAGSGGATTLVAPTGYTSYPEAGENANVIMDSVNKQIETSQESIIYSMAEQFGATKGEILETMGGNTGEILGALDEHNSNVTEQITATNKNMEENFEATNNYIQEGIDATTKLAEKVDEVAAKQQPVYIYKTSSSGSSGSSSSSKSTSTQATGPAASSSSSSSSTSSSSSSSNTIKYTEKSGLNTSQSIVDALKAAGQGSSFEDRAELYYANGGTGTYTGSSSQNTSMLNKLKEGSLHTAD